VQIRKLSTKKSGKICCQFTPGWYSAVDEEDVIVTAESVFSGLEPLILASPTVMGLAKHFSARIASTDEPGNSGKEEELPLALFAAPSWKVGVLRATCGQLRNRLLDESGILKYMILGGCNGS
jgi:hypothetical protein